VSPDEIRTQISYSNLQPPFMWNRVIFVAALAIAVALLPHVYLTVEAAWGLFPVDNAEILSFR